MSKFTPGPYFVTENGFIRQIGSNEGHRLYIASIVEVPFNFGGDKTTQANANLMAAAWEMYEALTKIKAILINELEEPVRRAFWEAVNALAKADGKGVA